MTPENLKSLRIFAGLSEEALAEIARAARERRVKAGDALFSQGAPADTYFVLVEGSVKVVQTTPDGRQVIVRFVGPGEGAGILAAFGIETYPATTVAVVDVAALAWDAKDAAALMKRHPQWAMATGRVVGDRVQEAHSRVRQLATERVEQRIARAVLHLAEQAGRAGAEGLLIELPVSRQEIAEMSGATLHTVSRVMSAWEEAGLISGGRRRIVVRDEAALRQLAGS